MEQNIKIYLDDVRTPVDKTWIVVRNYDEFVETVKQYGLEKIFIISLDHDLGRTAMNEYFTNVSPNFQLNYDNIIEKTGYDCAKWLVDYFYECYPEYLSNDRIILGDEQFPFPTVYTHSANPIGSANIMGYINNFFMNESRPQTCIRVQIQHT